MPPGVFERTDEYRLKMSVARKGKGIGIVPWNKGKKTLLITRIKNSESMKRKWQDPEYRNKMLEISNSKDNKNKKSVSLKKKWTDKNYRKRMIPILAKNGGCNDAYGKPGKYNNIIMRSNLERFYAKLFDKNNIKWEYESIYIFMDNGHIYIPDFYFPEINLIIEVKPKRFIHSKIAQYKKEQAKCKKYIYWFAHENNPKKTINCINRKGAA